MKKEIRRELIKSKKNFYKYHDKREEYTNNTLDYSIEYAGKLLPSIVAGNNQIKEILSEDKPKMIARFGANELSAMMIGYMNQFPIKNVFRYQQIKKRSWDFFSTAGYFPEDINLIPKFTELMIESCRELDMLGVWFNLYEDFVIEHFACQTKLCRLRSIEPYYCADHPWSEILEGKRVLVIHPFADTIERQYAKRDKLFVSDKILPRFELKTIKAVQTIGHNRDSRFQSWDEALEHMYQETLQVDYDIAIVGCGAYGFPLAAKIKKSGHSVIHMGGSTQILFGIKGKRWDKHELSSLYNEFWVRPSEEETPANLELVEEKGCYW